MGTIGAMRIFLGLALRGIGDALDGIGKWMMGVER